jgi:hypothetical protein
MSLNKNRRPSGLSQEEEILWEILLSVDSITDEDIAAVWGNITGDITNQAEFGSALGMATLDASGKLPSSQLPVEVVEYKGGWNAATNTPALTDASGTTGDQYKVQVAGTQDLGSGPIDFQANALVIHNGSIWEQFTGASPSYLYPNTLRVAEDASGSDGVKGDYNAPFSLQEALQNVSNGDVIVVTAGTYSTNYTIDSQLGVGVTTFTIISEGRVTIITSTTSFVSDTTGKDYTIIGDFDIIGHTSAPTLNFAHANSNIQVLVRKFVNDGDYIVVATGGTSRVGWEFMQISNYLGAITTRDCAMDFLVGDTDCSVGDVEFYRPGPNAYDTLVPNPKVGTPTVIGGGTFALVARNFSSTVGNCDPYIKGIHFMSDNFTVQHRRNMSFRFVECHLEAGVAFTAPDDVVKTSTQTPSGGAMTLEFENCKLTNRNTNANSNGYDAQGYAAATITLILRGTNTFDINNGESITGIAGGVDLPVKSYGYSGGNKDVAATTDFLVGSFDFNTDISN